MPTFEIENQHGGIVAGVDEAGLGPLAGPLVVCSCIITSQLLNEYLLVSINDSKKISHKKREKIFDIIACDNNFIYSLSIVSSEMIDQKGLSYAWKYGINESLSHLKVKPDIAIIDGNKKISIEGIYTDSIVKGDQKSYSIAAASIIAKVTRDRIMVKIHEEYPQYGFNKHVGYGTKMHMEALQRFGVTKYHRRSYAPVSKLCIV